MEHVGCVTVGNVKNISAEQMERYIKCEAVDDIVDSRTTVDSAVRNIKSENLNASKLTMHINLYDTQTIKSEPIVNDSSQQTAPVSDGDRTTVKPAVSDVKLETVDDNQPTDSIGLYDAVSRTYEQRANSGTKQLSAIDECSSSLIEVKSENEISSMSASRSTSCSTSAYPLSCLIKEEQPALQNSSICGDGSAVQSHTSRSNKLYQCERCREEFASGSDLQTHICCSHTEEKPFKCTIINKRYTARGTGDTHAECNIGGKQFYKQSDLKRHSYTHSGGESCTGRKLYTCNICDKQYTASSSLYVHMRTHKGPFKCTVCHKLFYKQNDLKKHSDLHLRENTRDKIFVCTVCSKHFMTRGALNAHTRTHTGDKRYQCTDCNKKFYTKGDLKGHSLVHILRREATRNKRYECTDCNKKFYTNGDLKGHSLVHILRREAT